MADELRDLAEARAQLASIAEERQQHLVELTRSRDALAVLARQGATKAQQRTARTRVTGLERSASEIDGRDAALRERIEGLRDRVRLRRPEDSVERLDGQVPVALFPVRLETRFGGGATELKVRIYPEQLHIDAHEPELTEREVGMATAYWDARWAATSEEQHVAAWRELLRSVRPARARWLVTATEPTNLDQLGTGSPSLPPVTLRSGPFTRQPTARLLPEQWVVIGYRAGAEVVRGWSAPVVEGLAVSLQPDPDDGGTAAVPDEQDTLALDQSIAWLVEYQAALDAGMAVTLTDAEMTAGRLADGLDELVVLGVDWGADAAAAAASIDEQLRRHAFTDGLAVLGTGVPTNNTDDSRAAPGTDPRLDGLAFDPVVAATAPDAVARLAAALGADPAVGLAGAPASGSHDDGVAGDMNNALWAATLGGFLDQMMAPVVTSKVADDVHDHFRRYVRGQGPYAALRIGRQPYGILPVGAGAVASGDRFVDGLSAQLAGLRPFWAQATSSVPRLGDSAQPDVVALDLLRRTPRSATFRFREAFAGSLSTSILGFDVVAIFQETIANFTLALAGIRGRPNIAGVTVNPAHRDVPVPLVARGELSEVDGLDPDYVAAVLDASKSAGGFRRLLSEPGEARTLLEALLRHAAASEFTIGSMQLVIDHEIDTAVLVEAPPIMRVMDPEIAGIERQLRVAGGPDAPVSVFATAESSVDLAELVISEVAQGVSLADHLALSSNAELRTRLVTRRFAEFRASLERLTGLPTAELDRLAGSTLDCVAHRLDAWITSVATRQLDTLRSEQGSGTYIGGFGYVEDVRPSTAPVSRGYLHAPSVSHATTAAILRSGHLAHGENDDGTLAVDLGSRRVGLALDLLDGVRRGQPIGALLGYRFERSVRDASMQLAKYILPIRLRTPLASVDTSLDPSESVETIAARDVVDGLALLDAWRPDHAAYYASLSTPVDPGDRPRLDALIEDLADALDAVTDLLVAETVHQAVMGNSERSAAALDALDHQQPLPDIGVVRTPRTATGHSHRLLVLFDADDAAPGWSVDDPRRAAEPRVDAWCGAVLGDPSRFRFAAEVRDADGAVLQTLDARLTDLGLSAVATVAACASAGTQATELEQRLALHFGALVTDPAAAELALLDDAPAGSAATALGLRDLVDLAAQIGDLLASARQADARALLPDTERAAAGVVLSELTGRADDAVTALAAAVSGLEGLNDATSTDDVVAALLAAADAGAPGAVPGAEDPHEQATRITAVARRTLDALEAAEDGFDRTITDDTAVAAHDLERLRTVFGASFPAVVRFTLPAPAAGTEDVRASLAASESDPALLADASTDGLDPATWLEMHATVRPAVARLTAVLEGAEMLSSRMGLADLRVAQLPHRPGAAWVGRPFAVTPPPTTSLVLQASSKPAFDGPLAGVVVDQWTEAVPSTSETTGVSFHFDAPGARAPQTVLIATPMDRTATHWTVGALADTVREAIALARIRPLDIDDVDAVARFLPAAYLPFNLEAKVPSINLAQIIAGAIEASNLVFTEANT